MFFLTRTAVELLAPFNLSLLLLLAGFSLILFRRRFGGIVLLGCGLSIIFFCGYGFFVKEYLAAQERLYPPLIGEQLQVVRGKQIIYVVVLGSDHVSDESLPVTSQIGGTSLYRLIEGMRIFRELPGSSLVLTGGIGYDPRPNADVVAETALAIGVPTERIIVRNTPRDTLQEAEILASLLGKDEFVLVTSALHMPRAMEIFRNRGMKPIPAPTDFILKKNVKEPPGSYLPSMMNLDLARHYVYELLGKIWMRIKDH